MPADLSVAPPSQPRSRYGFAAFCFLTLLVALTALRLGLFLKFGPGNPGATAVAQAFLIGLHHDLFGALLLVLPLLVWFLLVPNRWAAARWHRGLFWLAAFLWWFGEIFSLLTEYFFFEEFESRFNTVAVDYILYPKEVFINIWDSYPVIPVVLGCALFSGAWCWWAQRRYAGMWRAPVRFPRRFLWLAGVVIALAALSPGINLKGTTFSKDRTLNEIANNGTLTFLAAAWTRNLDYAAFYKTLPIEEAYARTRKLLANDNVAFVTDGRSIRRRVKGDATRPRLNVVLFLEESLGSEFWGSLGRPGATLTPEMDKLATEEGMLFTNLYASGNRTVRGMEGVLSSFPPLPGDSIVKRDRSDNVETIARVLKRDGYHTLFLYGGRGAFDGLRSFTKRNGYDRFIEQSDFANPQFTTIWGVCDEEVFARAIDEFRELSRTDQPFFGTILSVSNHKPYTYPAGRIPVDPNRRKRPHAVKYSDYALGQFFKAAKRESFWTNTIFVVVADHGARVYGSQSIPIHSYEIPLVILGPAAVTNAARIGTLGGSLDVAPTILGLLGRPYESLFFGRDLLNDPPAAGRALLNHNRDIGQFARDRLVVLGLKQTVEFYAGDPKAAEIKRLTMPTPDDRELEKDTAALYQVADDLYVNERYRIDEAGEAAAKQNKPASP